MRTRWTKEEIESVLIQLNNQHLPFNRYRFSREENGLVLLGSGGYANVYEMERKDNTKIKFAVKVLGFGEKHVDSDEFRKSVQIQKDLSTFQTDVVKIIDYVELRVFMDKSCQILDVIKVSEYEDKTIEGDSLSLQFILMEKLVPVMRMDAMGNPQLYPNELARYEESEIMKFAHNIGTALARSHEKRLLHRDIKLENVFYDPQKKLYKLGDFGIAKMTDDGMASTVAFTKGYGAPEVVGAIDERYDDTADIYSFGIMLYLLCNELKFPDSKNYNVNVSLQYSKGYQFPSPVHNNYELSTILDRMCQYNPDDRYQSMDKVMNDVEGIIIGDDIRFKKENKQSPYVVGFLCYVIGIILWKMTHMPELILNIGTWGYLFLGVSGFVYWLNLKKKAHSFLSVMHLGLGIAFLSSTGVNWWKLLFVLGMSISTGGFVGLGSIGVIVVDLVSKLMQQYPQIYSSMEEYKWMSALFLSFALVLCLQYTGLIERCLKIERFFKNNIYWTCILSVYGVVFLNGLVNQNREYQDQFPIAWLNLWNAISREYNFVLLGACGILMSIGWIIRENVLRKHKA